MDFFFSKLPPELFLKIIGLVSLYKIDLLNFSKAIPIYTEEVDQILFEYVALYDGTSLSRKYALRNSYGLQVQNYLTLLVDENGGFSRSTKASIKHLRLNGTELLMKFCKANASLLTNLEAVHIKCRKLQKDFVIPPELDSLRILSFENIRLQPVLTDFQRFTNLQELNLSGQGNMLSSLFALPHLPSLLRLDLSHNFLEIREFWAEKLTNLEELYMGYNFTRDIEDHDYWNHLKILELTGNCIVKINGLNKLTSLKKLYLGANEIKHVSGLDNLKELELLDLRRNYIGKIEGLDKLRNLKKLSLAENYIIHIEGLDELKELEVLDLSENAIQEITNLEYVVNLKWLDLSNCSIDKIKNLNFLKKLVFLDLRHNSIFHIDGVSLTFPLEGLVSSSKEAYSWQWKKAKCVDTDNFFKNFQFLQPSFRTIEFDDLKYFTDLKVLDLSKTNTKNLNYAEISKGIETLIVPRTVFNNLSTLKAFQNLKYLNLGSTELQSLEGISNFKNLTTLRIIRGPKIENMAFLGELTNLLQLQLSKCNIKKIENLKKLKALQVLDLSHNHISKIEDLDELKSLKILSFYDNQITKIENLENNKSLIILNLERNKLVKFENLELLDNLKIVCLTHNAIPRLGPVNECGNYLLICCTSSYWADKYGDFECFLCRILQTLSRNPIRFEPIKDSDWTFLWLYCRIARRNQYFYTTGWQEGQKEFGYLTREEASYRYDDINMLQRTNSCGESMPKPIDDRIYQHQLFNPRYEVVQRYSSVVRFRSSSAR